MTIAIVTAALFICLLIGFAVGLLIGNSRKAPGNRHPNRAGRSRRVDARVEELVGLGYGRGLARLLAQSEASRSRGRAS